MDSIERRLPVYLLLDCSESMVGEGIEALNRGVQTLMMDLHSEPHAQETVWLSIITFSNRAEQVVPLTELAGVRIPPLRVRPGTALGHALELLAAAIRREVRTHTATVKGDWRPMVFLLTDGMPTDAWQAAAGRLQALSGSRPMNVIAIGCGAEIDPAVLMELSGTALLMSDRPDDFRSLFRWISASLAVTSRALAGGAAGALTLEKLPAGATAAAGHPARPGAQPQLFVALRCSTTGRPYLIRYRRDEGMECYVPVRTHPVDEEYMAASAGSDVLAMSSRQLCGVLACPYCPHLGAGTCDCGTVMCAGEDECEVCPGCHQHVHFRGPGEFSLAGRMG
jgi:uncharacterized protein YegL